MSHLGGAEAGLLVRAQGIDKAFEALEVATQMVEDARPLLNQAIELVDEVRRLNTPEALISRPQ